MKKVIIMYIYYQTPMKSLVIDKTLKYSFFIGSSKLVLFRVH